MTRRNLDGQCSERNRHALHAGLYCDVERSRGVVTSRLPDTTVVSSASAVCRFTPPGSISQILEHSVSANMGCT